MHFKMKAEVIKCVKEVMLTVVNDNPVVFTASAGQLRVEVFDGVKNCAIIVKAETIDPGSCAIENRYIPSMMMFEGEVVFRVKDNKICLKEAGTGNTFDVPIKSCEVTRFEPKKVLGSVSIELSALKEMFKKVLFASGRGVVRDIDYGNILLECETDYIRAVAGDTRLLAMTKTAKSSSFTGEIKLPKSLVQVIRKITGPSSCLATLSFHENGISFFVDGDVVCDIFISGHLRPFPDYKATLPVHGTTHMTVDVNAFLSRIGKVEFEFSATITLGRGGNYVQKPARFFISDGKGASMEYYPEKVSWDGDDVRVKTNLKTLVEALSEAKGEGTIYFNGNQGPIYLTDHAGDYTCVMMPFNERDAR